MSTQSSPPGSPEGAAANPAAPGRSVREVAVRRMRMSLLLAIIMMVFYFAFTVLAAFATKFLAIQVADSITLALVLSVATIILPWILAWIYMNWASQHHDAECERLLKGRTP